VLVAEGGFLYMRQKKMAPTLEEIDVDVLSSKGAQDVGLHVFSTSGLLDDSGYNRAFWMYSKRWPGFQLANQAPKTGQLLVTDDEKTYAVREFYHRNVHSPMFFPGTEGYLLFADSNTNEPQIVGETGPDDPYAAFEARKGGQIVAVSADDGKTLSETQLESPPVFNGLIAAGGCLFASLRDGTVVCLGPK